MKLEKSLYLQDVCGKCNVSLLKENIPLHARKDDLDLVWSKIENDTYNVYFYTHSDLRSFVKSILFAAIYSNREIFNQKCCL